MEIPLASSDYSSHFSSGDYTQFTDKPGFSPEENGAVDRLNLIVGKLNSGQTDNALKAVLDFANLYSSSSDDKLAASAKNLGDTAFQMNRSGLYNSTVIYQALQQFYAQAF